MNISESNIKDKIPVFTRKNVTKRYNKLVFRRFVRRH